MAQTILCSTDSEHCSCGCNCKAYFSNDRMITAESITIDGAQYAFSYIITDPSPALNSIIFCIQCPSSTFAVSSGNTAIQVIGNPNVTPVYYTLCTTPPCPVNSYAVEYELGEESECCSNQGIMIGVNSGPGISEIRFILTFTLPAGVVFSYQSGTLRISNGPEVGIVNYICMPGCANQCKACKNICEMWAEEEKILISKKDVFIHYSQTLFPDSLDLSTLTLNELESRVRQLQKLENSTAKLNCNIAKVLAELNKNICNNTCCVQ